MALQTQTDLLIVGGGIHGCGIARDAAGRGLRVTLVEKHDLASATSSASSKLIHGGLRYLEQLEFRLVREALGEREILLRAAPHLVTPMRFVMPYSPELRPRWVLRAGLMLYDGLARRDTLPATGRVDFTDRVLKPHYRDGYAYSDCRVDDARLVVANALDASERGAEVHTRTACVDLQRRGDVWYATVVDAGGGRSELTARVVVNAAGPWVRDFLTAVAGVTAAPELKLVQGSHIVLPRLYEGDHAFILQNEDRRVVFVCPFNGETLVGTTDVPISKAPHRCEATAEEVAYLCDTVNRYFARQIAPAAVIWRYSGVRALADDGAAAASRVTRDYVLHFDTTGAPILSIFGGKITTYRRLAERALEKIAAFLPAMQGPWTGNATLPGGDAEPAVVVKRLSAESAALPHAVISALVQRHGSRAERVLSKDGDLGEHFGADLYAREVDYFIAQEWAREGDDVLWRRTKAGLHLNAQQRARVTEYVRGRVEAL